MFEELNKFRAERATISWPSKKMDRTKIQINGKGPVGQTEQDGSSW